MFNSILSKSTLLILALSAGGCTYSASVKSHAAEATQNGEAKEHDEGSDHDQDGDRDAAKQAGRSMAELLAQAKSEGIFNARVPEEDLLCSGQLTQEQFEFLATSGYGTFINLRGLDEHGSGWEAERAQLLEVNYISIPVLGAEGLSEANARLLASALKQAEGPVSLYCGSSNRVGALYALGAFYVDGKSAEECLVMAEAGGATSMLPMLKQALGLDG